MEIITIREAHKMSSPHPFALLVSKNIKDVVNVMGVSWWTFISSKPPKLMVSIGEKSYTSSNIKKNCEFTLCLPDQDFRRTAWQCGTTSGKIINKIEKYNIKTMKSKYINVPILTESHVAFECKIMRSIKFSDHSLFIANILNIYGDHSKNHLYANKGYNELVIFDIV